MGPPSLMPGAGRRGVLGRKCWVSLGFLSNRRGRDKGAQDGVPVPFRRCQAGTGSEETRGERISAGVAGLHNINQDGANSLKRREVGSRPNRKRFRGQFWLQVDLIPPRVLSLINALLKLFSKHSGIYFSQMTSLCLKVPPTSLYWPLNLKCTLFFLSRSASRICLWMMKDSFIFQLLSVPAGDRPTVTITAGYFLISQLELFLEASISVFIHWHQQQKLCLSRFGLLWFRFVVHLLDVLADLEVLFTFTLHCQEQTKSPGNFTWLEQLLVSGSYRL